MKKILLCLLGILLVIVEMSITNYIDIFNVSFNLVIIYITIISLYLDKTEVSIIGAIIGLVKDIAVGGIFGVNGLILFTVGYGISLLKNEIYKSIQDTLTHFESDEFVKFREENKIDLCFDFNFGEIMEKVKDTIKVDIWEID